MITPHSEENCDIAKLISALSGRWKLLILFWLLQEPCRFNHLQRKLGAITHRTLARQLNELSEVGFVARKDHQTIPPHVEYSPTPLGHTLVPVLQAMHTWANDHASKITSEAAA